MGEESGALQWRRRRWGRWVGGAVVLLIVAVVGGHAYWDHRARGGFEATLEGLRRTGEPVDPAGFAEADVGDGENAVVDLRAAGATVDRGDPDWQALEAVPIALPLDGREMAAVEKVVTAKRAALERLKAAAGKGRVNWGLDPATPGVFLKLNELTPARACANLLARAALVAHVRGREGEALARVREMLAVARAVDRQRTMISHLVAIGIGAMASEAAGQVAPDLRVGAGGASAAEVRGLIDELMDDRAWKEGLVWAMRRERLNVTLLTRQIAAGDVDLATQKAQTPTAGARASLYAMRPILFDDGRFAVVHLSGVAKALAASNDYREFGAIVPKFPEAEIERDKWRHPLSAILLPSVGRFTATHYRYVAERRMAAVALACAGYAAAHGGQRPASLDELVGEWLAGVPADPFAPGRARLGYRATGEPVVYSVGEDGRDDGGSERPVKRRYVDATMPVSRWECEDAVWPLVRRARVRAPEAVPDGAGVGEAEEK